MLIQERQVRPEWAYPHRPEEPSAVTAMKSAKGAFPRWSGWNALRTHLRRMRGTRQGRYHPSGGRSGSARLESHLRAARTYPSSHGQFCRSQCVTGIRPTVADLPELVSLTGVYKGDQVHQ